MPLAPGPLRLLGELEATASAVGAADNDCEILGDIGGTLACAPIDGFGTATATAGAAGAMLGELEATTVGAANDGCGTLGVIDGTLNVVVIKPELPGRLIVEPTADAPTNGFDTATATAGAAGAMLGEAANAVGATNDGCEGH